MAKARTPIAVYLEVGQKRTFAGAIEWPGWCCAGHDEESALAALVEYGPRYAEVLSRAKLEFTPPGDPAGLTIAERLEGNTTTEFGAPDVAPAHDAEPFEEAERARSETILAAIWRAFDRAVQAAEGKDLRKGPRGGGRERDGIVRHVLGADAGYLRRLAQKVSQDEAGPLDDQLRRTREAIRAALVAGVRGEIPETGPRGGAL